MRFIGDTHAKFDKYQDIVNGCESSIQVGDFGAGFAEIPDLGNSHRFIRGNHDNPSICRNHPNWIPDGTVEGRMFFLGGGYSIDHARRVEGVDYWSDEQLTSSELYTALQIYEQSDCDIVITHECPSEIAPLVFNKNRDRIIRPSRTSQALSAILEIRKPKLWIFGHWHTPVDEEIDGTRFICLAELAYIDIDI
jgi:predicted phosphodiesterase